MSISETSGAEGVNQQHIDVYRGVPQDAAAAERQAALGGGEVVISADGGNMEDAPHRRLFAVAMPDMTGDQVTALQALVQAFGGEMTEVTAADCQKGVGYVGAVVVAQEVAESAEAQEAINYLTTYNVLQDHVDTVIDREVPHADRVIPFEKKETKGFAATGARAAMRVGMPYESTQRLDEHEIATVQIRDIDNGDGTITVEVTSYPTSGAQIQLRTDMYKIGLGSGVREQYGYTHNSWGTRVPDSEHTVTDPLTGDMLKDLYAKLRGMQLGATWKADPPRR